MAATAFLVCAFLTFILNLPMASDELDEATRERTAQQEMARLWQQREERTMEEKAQEQSSSAWVTLLFDTLQPWHLCVSGGVLVLFFGVWWWMTRLLQKTDKRTLRKKAQKQSSFAWGALLFDALPQWYFWVIAGVLVLDFGLSWWIIRLLQETDKRTRDKKAQEQSIFSWGTLLFDLQQWHFCVITGILFLLFGLISWFRKTICNKQQSKKQKHEKKLKKLGEICREDRERIKKREAARELVHSLIRNIRRRVSNSSFPGLEPPIGVDRDFEGWGSCGGVPLYRFIVPLRPRHGHVFRLEPDTAGRNPARIFHIRVKSKCTCTTKECVQGTWCFCHHLEEDARGNQAHGLLQTLCTSSYLDVEKTAAWFDENVKAVWKDLPQASQYWLRIVPSRRSCAYQLGRGRQIILKTEIIFGVQQMDSDIFVSGEPSENPPTPSTTWTVSFAVAEFKFFRHMIRQAPNNCVYLKCLRTCAHLLEGTSLSIYTFKIAVMHLLNLIGPSGWDNDNFVPRMVEITRYMHCCLDEKCLRHFFYGYDNAPQDIILPPQWRTAGPLNLFQHLRRDSEAHARALRDLREVQVRFTQLILGY